MFNIVETANSTLWNLLEPYLISQPINWSCKKYIINNCILIKLTNAYILTVSEMAVLLYVVVFSLTCLLGPTVGAELESCHGAGLKYLNNRAPSVLGYCF